MSVQPEVIKARFNLFKEGREYPGHHRKQIIENARGACYDPATREGIRLREKLGYLGRGRLETAQKLRIGETEIFKMPDGSPIAIENAPSNVTVFFEIDEHGNVEHHQEILKTGPGKVVSSLNRSGVGGFFWAMAEGFDHRFSTFEGFDYMAMPGLTVNCSSLLASASAKDSIMESICKHAGLSQAEAEGYLNNWDASAQYRVAQLEEGLERAAAVEFEQAELLQQYESELVALREKNDRRREIVLGCIEKSRIGIPPNVADAIISMTDHKDFFVLAAFLESACFIHSLQRKPAKAAGRHLDQEVSYGSAAAAIDFLD